MYVCYTYIVDEHISIKHALVLCVGLGLCVQVCDLSLSLSLSLSFFLSLPPSLCCVSVCMFVYVWCVCALVCALVYAYVFHANSRTFIIILVKQICVNHGHVSKASIAQVFLPETHCAGERGKQGGGGEELKRLERGKESGPHDQSQRAMESVVYI